jgi:hypothetical protein
MPRRPGNGVSDHGLIAMIAHNWCSCRDALPNELATSGADLVH